MVKHGRNKKLRCSSRRNKRMRNSNQVAKFKNPRGLIKDEAIRQSWDPKRAPLDNLKSVGLRSKVNDDVRVRPPSVRVGNFSIECLVISLQRLTNVYFFFSLCFFFPSPPSGRAATAPRRLPPATLASRSSSSTSPRTVE